MARIDRILSIVAEQGANELRVGTDREPKMLAYGTVKRLSLPMTTAETLRDLLGEILSPEREEAMRARGRVEATYTAADLGLFQVTLTGRNDGFDVVFRRTSSRASTSIAHEPAPATTSESIEIESQTSPGAGLVGLTTTTTSDAATKREALAAGIAHAPPESALTPTETFATPALAELVAHAVARRASDVHLSDDEPPVIRIDGRLHRLAEGPISIGALLPLGPIGAARFVTTGSVDLGVEVPGVGRVRVHVFRADGCSAAAIRLLPSVAPPLAALNHPVPLEDLIELPHGLVLICGAAGSGKSTTLAALAQEALRRRSIVLATLEDPIEYELTPDDKSIVRRRQIGRDVTDFASGLRDVLRQDPNLILIGEMRDTETITLALTAAETGHLVLASLHSRSAASAVERIVDAYPPERAAQVRLQLAESLRAVVAQRLLPRARGSGRIPAIEVMRTTHAIASLIREAKTAQIGSAIQSGRREGMITLERSLADRVVAGDIRVEDARAAADDPAALALYLAKP